MVLGCCGGTAPTPVATPTTASPIATTLPALLPGEKYTTKVVLIVDQDVATFDKQAYGMRLAQSTSTSMEDWTVTATPASLRVEAIHSTADTQSAEGERGQVQHGRCRRA